ncbi:MAG TPA: hypothetical protein PK777_09665, partial [Thermoguttaceae bacterium]|nr:hypothetical protein [Thermoguttaceae bacterium]
MKRNPAGRGVLGEAGRVVGIGHRRWQRMRFLRTFFVLVGAILVGRLSLADTASTEPAPPERLADGQVVKAVLEQQLSGEDLLRPDGWQPYEQGFQKEGEVWVCDNGDDAKARRGLSQQVVLNQKEPAPIIAIASSKAEAVRGNMEGNYAVYLDLRYQDGTPLYGQQAAFAAGSHDWQERRVLVIP